MLAAMRGHTHTRDKKIEFWLAYNLHSLCYLINFWQSCGR